MRGPPNRLLRRFATSKHRAFNRMPQWSQGCEEFKGFVYTDYRPEVLYIRTLLSTRFVVCEYPPIPLGGRRMLRLKSKSTSWENCNDRAKKLKNPGCRLLLCIRS